MTLFRRQVENSQFFPCELNLIFPVLIFHTTHSAV